MKIDLQVLKNSGIWSEVHIYKNIFYSKRVSNEIPLLKRIISLPLFDAHRIYKIHLRRVDLKEVDNKDKLIDLTEKLCLFNVYEYEKQYFFKFGCIFFNNSNELVKLNKSDMSAIAYKLQKEYLEKHLDTRDAKAVITQHISFLLDFIQKKRGDKWVMDQQQAQV